MLTIIEEKILKIDQKLKSKFLSFFNIKLLLQVGLSAFWAVILTGTFIKFF